MSLGRVSSKPDISVALAQVSINQRKKVFRLNLFIRSFLSTQLVEFDASLAVSFNSNVLTQVVKPGTYTGSFLSHFTAAAQVVSRSII